MSIIKRKIVVNTDKKQGLKCFFILLLVCVLCHGLPLLNHGVFWDGWLLYFTQKTGNYHPMHVQWIVQGKAPFLYLIERTIMSTGIFGIHRYINFVCIFMSGYLVYRSFLITLHPRVIAMVAGITALSAPGSMLTSFSIMSYEYILILLFFCGFFLGSRSLMTANSKEKWLCGASSILFFILSFSYNSLIVFYFAFIVWCCYIQTRLFGSSLSVQAKFKRVIFPQIYLSIVPFSYWFIYKLFGTVTTGAYASYNLIDVTKLLDIPNQIIWLSPVFIGYVLIPASVSILFSSIITICIFIYRKKCLSYSSVCNWFVDHTGSFCLVFIGLLSLYFTFLPYFVVDKVPVFGLFPDQTSRFIILVPFAITFINAGLIGFFLRKDQGLSAAGWVFAIVLFISYLFYWTFANLSLEGQSAVKSSLIYHLRKSEGRSFSFYWFKTGFKYTYFPSNSIYTWEGVLHEAFGDFARVGYRLNENIMPSGLENNIKAVFCSFVPDVTKCSSIASVKEIPDLALVKKNGYEYVKNILYNYPNAPDLYKQYHLDSLNINGPKTLVTYKPLRYTNVAVIGFYSLVTRYFSPSQYVDFLKSLMSVTINSEAK